MRNFDIQLVEKIETYLNRAKNDSNFFVDDAFEDLSEERKAKVRAWLDDVLLISDLTDRRSGGNKELRLMFGFPRLEVAFPQVCLQLSSERAESYLLGDGEGEETEVYDIEDPTKVVGYTSAYEQWVVGTYFLDIFSTTFWETYWISKLVERCVREALAVDFDNKDYGPHSIMVNDLSVDQNHTPEYIYARRITLTTQYAQGWRQKKDINGKYDTGENKALEELGDG